MSSERRRLRRRVVGALFAISFVACTGEKAVGCSPSLTCSYNPSKFDAPPRPDAGPRACDETRGRCSATTITAGAEHTCAVAEAGEVLCWGSDDRGQRGPADPVTDPDAGPFTGFSTPVPNGAEVAAGGSHTCALTVDADVLCWGSDDAGQVSGEPSAESREPRPIGIRAFGVPTSIAAGDAHTCAVVDSQVACWGANDYGQRDPRPDAAATGISLVAATDGAVEVVAGARHTCARFDDGHVACWGELLDDAGSWTRVAEPTPVAGIETATELAAAGAQTCARLQDGRVGCWGGNDSGQLGDGTTTSRAVPVFVPGATLYFHVATGGRIADDSTRVGHTCVLDKDFYVWCWGENGRGELGAGEGPDRATPARVLAVPSRDSTDSADLDGIAAITAGAHHVCALNDNGRAYCWGDDSAGQLDSIVTPTPMTFGRAVGVPRFSRRRGP